MEKNDSNFAIDPSNANGSGLKYADLTSKIIGSAMQVHTILGNGFQEVVYQRALGVELGLQQISYIRESEQPIFYKGCAVGTRRVDNSPCFGSRSKICLRQDSNVSLGVPY